jgi:hypothetical protein
VVEARTAEAGARAELTRLRDQHVSLEQHLEGLRGKMEGGAMTRANGGDGSVTGTSVEAIGAAAAAAAAAESNRARAARVAAAEAAGLTGTDLVAAAAGGAADPDTPCGHVLLPGLADTSLTQAVAAISSMVGMGPFNVILHPPFDVSHYVPRNQSDTPVNNLTPPGSDNPSAWWRRARRTRVR